MQKKIISVNRSKGDAKISIYYSVFLEETVFELAQNGH